MSLENFWASVLSGTASSRMPALTTGSSTLDREDCPKTENGADLWLTRKAVGGFDEKDFDFLAPEERDLLARSVAGFLDIARLVPANKPATRGVRLKSR